MLTIMKTLSMLVDTMKRLKVMSATDKEGKKNFDTVEKNFRKFTIWVVTGLSIFQSKIWKFQKSVFPVLHRG